MQHYDQLTPIGQARRLRRLASDALAAYGFQGADFRLIHHWMNTTFRVDVPCERKASAYDAPFVPGRYLLRLHRANDRTRAQIESELAWLSALSEQSQVVGPVPMCTSDGDAAYEVQNTDCPELGMASGSRVCSLLRWVPGRILKKPHRRHAHIYRIGVTLARLHGHARQWQPSQPLDRPPWDLPALMGRNNSIGIDPDVWNELPAEEHDVYAACEEHLAETIATLGTGPEVFGLIHADLHFNNVLFVGEQARPIDFDDIGQSHDLLDLATVVHGFDPPVGARPWQEALVAGYRSARSLPDEVLMHLDVFLAARQTMLLLWFRTNARTRADFRGVFARCRESFLADIRARLDPAGK